MQATYEQWLKHDEYKETLHNISQEEIADQFYQTVPFGTGGMRGKLGAGTNRINKYTIRLVAEGLAREIDRQGPVAKARGVVIAYDTRHFSQEFAYETAGVLAAHGIQSYVFTESRPTPELSFAVRYLAAFAGVVITASHNPKEYNGFKVYGEDGAQLTPRFADEIVAHMNEIEDIFAIQSMPKEDLVVSDFCVEVLEKIDNAYQQALKRLATEDMKDLKVVYTPLHGSGLVPIQAALEGAGFQHVFIVEQQAIQSGEFPTVIYPNPEEQDAFTLAIEEGQKREADVLLATDPDADRLGVAILDGGQYRLLTGNQLGALLLQFILETTDIAPNAAMVKTIVTSEFGTAIANKFGIATVNTLTGFKFIAEKIAEWEQTKEHTFIFGYEESYGYLAGDFVRDKDAVQMALLTAEMASYYKNQGKTLLHVLHELYTELGWYKEALVSLTFEGIKGQKRIANIMTAFRTTPPKELAGIPVVRVEDYQLGIADLPKADVLKFILADDSWVCVRPSGTEPKCKFYFGVNTMSEQQSETLLTQLKTNILHIVN